MKRIGIYILGIICALVDLLLFIPAEIIVTIIIIISITVENIKLKNDLINSGKEILTVMKIFTQCIIPGVKTTITNLFNSLKGNSVLATYL